MEAIHGSPGWRWGREREREREREKNKAQRFKGTRTREHAKTTSGQGDEGGSIGAGEERESRTFTRVTNKSVFPEISSATQLSKREREREREREKEKKNKVQCSRAQRPANMLSPSLPSRIASRR
jgi:hypothetical protein